jgi:hypothetical protein
MLTDRPPDPGSVLTVVAIGDAGRTASDAAGLLLGATNRAINWWIPGEKLRAQLPKRAADDRNAAAASDLMHHKERDLRE